MKGNPYELLGITPDASEKEIKSAYRQLAKKLHPDLNPGDARAEERFKEISSAHALLSDKEQRARFDRGEIDAAGNEKSQPQQQYYRSYAESGPEHHYYNTGGFSDFGDESDLFSELFGRAHAKGSTGWKPDGPYRGSDVQYQLKVDFLDAVCGAKRRITMPDGSNLDVTVPAGIEDGQNLRLKGKGTPGGNGGSSGDAFVKIEIFPHRNFKRDKRNILLELPISLDEAVLGAKIPVPTIQGTVTMAIPVGASSGQILRLKGKGISASGKKTTGDQLVQLKIVLPKNIDPELQAFFESWQQKNSYAVRKNLEGAI